MKLKRRVKNSYPFKGELAANQGYKVIRIKLSKSLLNKAYDEQTIFKKIKSCINQYQLFQ